MTDVIKAVVEIPMNMHILVRVGLQQFKLEPRIVTDLRLDEKPTKVYDIFKNDFRLGVGTFKYITTAMTSTEAFDIVASQTEGGR